MIVSYFGDSYRSYRLVFGSILQLQLLVFFIKSSNTANLNIGLYMGSSDIFGLLKWCFSNTKLIFTSFKDTMKEWTTFQISVNWNLRSFYLCLCPECKSCGSGKKAAIHLHLESGKIGRHWSGIEASTHLENFLDINLLTNFQQLSWPLNEILNLTHFHCV